MLQEDLLYTSMALRGLGLVSFLEIVDMLDILPINRISLKTLQMLDTQIQLTMGLILNMGMRRTSIPCI